MDFKGKLVLVTGSSAGIGAATAVYFAGLGANLVLTGRNEDNLRIIADKCREQNASIQTLTIPGNLTNPRDIERIISETINTFDRLDVLVNNAGYGKTGNLEEITLEDYEEIFNTNVKAVLYLTKIAMPHLIKAKGSVVNVSSASSLRALPSYLAYVMSKAALDHFTRCVALEVASKQVRVNSVNPGSVPTEFQKRSTNKDVAAQMECFAKLHPIGRVGQPKEIAAAIAFLASDLASNITGTILSVDGGYAISPPS